MRFDVCHGNDFIERQLSAAVKGWDPTKPRRWLARYGGLMGNGIGNSPAAIEYKALLEQASALTQNKRPEGSDGLPNLDYPGW